MTQIEQLLSIVDEIKELNLTKREQIQLNVYLAQNNIVKELKGALRVVKQMAEAKEVVDSLI